MSITASYSITIKSINQDAHASASSNSGSTDIAYIMVADGVGSHAGSERTSAFVCEAAKKEMETAGSSDFTWRRAFSNIHEKLNESYSADEDNKTGPATTFIAAFETALEIKAAYVGNGGIFHIRANLNQFKLQNVFVPWSVVNYLNPHTNCSENQTLDASDKPDKNAGRETLYKFFSAESKGRHIPSEIVISKDANYYGDILMICTDGVYSADKLSRAIREQETGDTHWIMIEPVLEIFCAHLQKFIIGSYTSEDKLQDMLEIISKECLAKGYVDDDFTLAVLITEKALSLYKQTPKTDE